MSSGAGQESKPAGEGEKPKSMSYEEFLDKLHGSMHTWQQQSVQDTNIRLLHQEKAVSERLDRWDEDMKKSINNRLQFFAKDVSEKVKDCILSHVNELKAENAGVSRQLRH